VAFADHDGQCKRALTGQQWIKSVHDSEE